LSPPRHGLWRIIRVRTPGTSVALYLDEPFQELGSRHSIPPEKGETISPWEAKLSLDSVAHVTRSGGNVTGPVSPGGNITSGHMENLRFEELLGQAQTLSPTPAGVSMPEIRALAPAPYAIHGLETLSSSLKSSPASWQEQLRVYKEDQLLAHPGGDWVDLEAPNPLESPPPQEGFFQRIGKDLKDAAANLVNFFKDLFGGSTYRYIDENQEVKTAQRRGIGGTILEFFKDLASGLSFGFFRPDGEPEPKNILERLSFAWQKVVGEALVDDLVLGLPSSAIHVLDDAALAAWNLLEVVPDATIGNLPGGRELVTTVFDNGQVLIDYITDCLPSGEAWMRVHAFEVNGGELVPPILYNLKLPERYGRDSRWSTVRNTPFRKTIETVGSLLADVALAKFTTHGPKTSKRRQ
jgi:hypothetical protein